MIKSRIISIKNKKKVCLERGKKKEEKEKSKESGNQESGRLESGRFESRSHIKQNTPSSRRIEISPFNEHSCGGHLYLD